jgi:hypothetical protein
MNGSFAPTGVGLSSRPGSDFRYAAIAARSLSVICDVESAIISAMGPVAAVMRLWPVFR